MKNRFAREYLKFLQFSMLLKIFLLKIKENYVQIITALTLQKMLKKKKEKKNIKSPLKLKHLKFVLFG